MEPKAFQIIRGGEEGATFISFKEIVAMKPQQISQLCAMKGRELNYFHGSDWRKRIWWIHRAAREPENE